MQLPYPRDVSSKMDRHRCREPVSICAVVSHFFRVSLLHREVGSLITMLLLLEYVGQTGNC